MLMPPLTVAVQLTFKDREARTSQMTFRLLASLSLTQMLASAEVVINAATALSNAVLIDYSIVYRVVDNNPPAADPNSDVRVSLDLFYTNLSTAYGISIPSPTMDLLTTINSMPNYLLDRRNPVVLAKVEALTSALELTTEEDGSLRTPMLLNGVLSI